MTVPVPDQLEFISDADGVSKDFSYPKRFLQADEIVVLVRDASGNDTAKSLGQDYSIAGSSWPSGGTISFYTAPPAGSKVVRYRDTQAKQTVDLENKQRNDAKAVEQQLDRMAMLGQDLRASSERGVKFPVGDVPRSLPPSSQRAGKILSFDGNGQPEATVTKTDVSIVAGIASDVSVVSSIALDVVAVAANKENINKVAAIDDEVTDVAAVADNIPIVVVMRPEIQAVIDDKANIGTVASHIASVDKVAAIDNAVAKVAAIDVSVAKVAVVDTDVTKVANISTDVSTVAADRLVIAAVHANKDHIDTVAANITSVNSVAGIAPDVETVAYLNGDVTKVADIAVSVPIVAAIDDEILSVAANKTNISAVANNKSNIDAVADNKTNIDAVKNNATNINTVAAKGTDIDTVAANISAVSNVSGISDDVTAVSTIKGNVTTVATISAQVNDVALIADDVETVALNSLNVAKVASNEANIIVVANNTAKVAAVADNIVDVVAAANNMDAIKAAPSAAETASTKADESNQSAEDAQEALVTVEGIFVNMKGGTVGQILAKLSGEDYAYKWVTPDGGGDMYEIVWKPIIEANSEARHTHSNKETLDATSAAFTIPLKTKVDSVETGAQKNPDMALYQAVSGKNVSNGYAGLGSDGKLDESLLPALAIIDTFPVVSEAAMLALNAQKGDVAIRQDIGKTFILRSAPANTLANWSEMITPASGVQSVGLQVPVGFQTGGAVTSSGNLTLTYAEGYQGYTTAEANKLAAIAANADKTTSSTVGAALAGPTPSTTLNDGDKFGGILSGGADLAIWSWATVKASIKLFTDTLYATKTQGGKADTAVQPDAMNTALASKQDKLNFTPVNQNGGTMLADPTVPLGVATRNFVESLVVGVNQSWQDVTASRARNTAYQNTTGKPIIVAISEGEGRKVSLVIGLEISQTGTSNWIAVATPVYDGSTDAGWRLKASGPVLVPVGHFYRFSYGVGPEKWLELR